MSSFRIIKHSTVRYMLIALLLALFMSLTLMSCGSSGDSSDKHVHTYSSSWSRDAKDHWHAATCGHDVTSDKAAHTYGDWAVVTEATATRDGLRRKTCSVCRYAQEEVIPKTGPEASDAEALNGVFSVSSSGKGVSFSKGNLYYTGSVWKFENNQYDFRTWSGKDAVVNGVYSSTGTPSGNVGLFYWSKDKNVAIAETYNDPGRSADDTFFVNTDSSLAGADWIALSSSEWDFLLNTRSNASSKRGLASINTGSTSVKGLVLLPDSWTLPNGCNFTGTEGSYSTNSYTKAQWSAMEAAGAVFFPASGIRAGSSSEYVQSDGYYGSSTPSADKDYANEMGFYIGLIGADSYDRIYGGSIRPVMSKSHTHTYSSEWTSDADYHWHASTCGHDVVSDKAAHTYGNWTTITDATTTSTGLCEHTCTVCGYVQTMIIPIVIPDHTHTYASAWSSDTNYHWHASTCGHDVTKDKAAHTWNGGTVTTSATHTASGVKTYTCTVCGKTKTETIPAQTDAHTYATAWTSDADYHWHASTCGHDVVSDKAAHTYGNWTTVTDATTTSTGLCEHTCTVCGYVQTEVIPVVIPDHTHTYASAWSSDTNYHWHASTCGHDVTSDRAAHSWNSGVVTTSATHTANGVKTYTCTVCGKTKTETIPAQIDAHTYATEWTSDGDYHWHASTCGHDVTSDRAVHSWNSGTVTTSATHTANGVKTYTCTVCGKTKTETIPAQTDAHTYATAWTSDADYHWHASTCGHDVTKDKALHTYGNWTTVTDATTASSGLRRRTCMLCGYAQKEVISPIGALNGVFTVNSSGKQVRFSKGNLYYTGSEWGFEDNQYDFRTWSGRDAIVNGVYSSAGTPSGNVGLFKWTKDTDKAVVQGYDSTGSSTEDTFFVNTDATVAGADWVALTRDEWNYLLFDRSNASSMNGLATINTGSAEVKGIVILPDSWTLPSSCTFTGGYENGYETNLYTKAQWSAMEASGAVFLPAAGWRQDRDRKISEVQSMGRYYSSTPNSSSVVWAHSLEFNENNISVSYSTRDSSKSVRPVVEITDHTHTFSTVWTNDANYHWHTSTCGHDLTLNKGVHNYGSWIVVTAATATSTGLRRAVCTVCGYVFEETIPKLKDGALNGVFTVDSSGKQVRFSKGNLYYTGSEWGFEDNQYDFRTWSGKAAVVNGAYSSTSTPSGNVGLFYWSKDKNIAVAEIYNDPDRSTDDAFFVNADSSVAGADWKALSSEEWHYLLFERPSTYALSKIGLATIDTGSSEVKGLVVLPDSWVLPSGCIFTSGYGSGYEINTYTKAQWEAMEESGAVFLPAAGYRSSGSFTSLWLVQSYCIYWSSTPDYSDAIKANQITFHSDSCYSDYVDRNGGNSVRPVMVIY